MANSSLHYGSALIPFCAGSGISEALATSFESDKTTPNTFCSFGSTALLGRLLIRVRPSLIAKIRARHSLVSAAYFLKFSARPAAYLHLQFLHPGFFLIVRDNTCFRRRLLRQFLPDPFDCDVGALFLAHSSAYSSRMVAADFFRVNIFGYSV